MNKSFTVFSDHKPLENMNIKARTDEDLGELTYYLSQYDFKIKYSPGKNNIEADCLSRNPVLQPDENTEDQLKIVNCTKLNDIVKDQEENENVQQKKDKLIQKQNVYYKKATKKEKIILSDKLSIEVIKNSHKHLCHIGIKQMQKKIGNSYTAQNLTKNIKRICEAWATCKKNKSRGHNKIGLMSQLGPATRPFEIVSIDTIGGFGGTRSTKKYLHLLLDHYTRYSVILTSKTQTAKDFIKLVKNGAETNYIGTILTNQYPGINSREFKEFLEGKNIPIIFTAVNAPFSNGLNEILNQTIVNKTRCKINEKKGKKAWTSIAQECVKQYNETEHTVTGFAPAYLLEGTNVTILPNELKKKKKTEKKDWIQDRIKALENTKKSHKYNKGIYDENRKHVEFKVGDTVLVENGNKLNRRKLELIGRA